MTNEELARWIANEIGFDVGSGPPSYFNKSQLGLIRDYILERNEAMECLDELENETADDDHDESDE